MINLKSIQSLTDFKRNTAEHLKELNRSGGPLILTVNGRAKLVVMDAEAFQEIADRLEYADSVLSIQEGYTVSQNTARCRQIKRCSGSRKSMDYGIELSILAETDIDRSAAWLQRRSEVAAKDWLRELFPSLVG